MLPARILDAARALPLDESPPHVYLSRLAPRSRRTQQGALATLARMLSGGTHSMDTLPWAELRYQHTQALRRQLADRYAVATANRMLAALRGCLLECWRLGLVDRESYARAVDLAPVRGVAPPHGRALDGGELRALLAACHADATPAGSRDAALLGLLYACGLRRAEAVALDVGDYDPTAGSVLVRKGKGGKARVVWPAAGARALLDAWLCNLRERYPQNIPAGDSIEKAASGKVPLFVRIRRGGALTAERLSDQSVRLILGRRAGQAGIAACSPHDLRRTFVGDLLQANVDIATVQRLVGHASVVTTQKYDRRGETVKQLAAARLDATFAGDA